MGDALRERAGGDRATTVGAGDLLRAAGVAGTLVYTDAACGLHAITLPDLRPAPRPDAPGSLCRFELRPDGEAAAPAGATWLPDGSYAFCRAGATFLRRPPASAARLALDGCVLAAQPGSNRLTVSRRGAVVEADPGCIRGGRCEQRVLVSRGELRTAAARHPNVPVEPSAILRLDVVDAAWLSPVRVLLLVRLTIDRVGDRSLLVVVDGGRASGTHPFLDGGRDRIVTSPRGGFAWVGGTFALRGSGRRLLLPEALGAVHAAAWSPDERWLALATREAVAFVSVANPVQPIRLPLAATDLGWR